MEGAFLAAKDAGDAFPPTGETRPATEGRTFPYPWTRRPAKDAAGAASHIGSLAGVVTAAA